MLSRLVLLLLALVTLHANAATQQGSTVSLCDDTATVTADITVSAGQIIFVQVFQRSANGGDLTGQGYTLDYEVANNDNADYARWYSKVAGGGEADPQLTGLDTGASNGSCITARVFSGIDALAFDTSSPHTTQSPTTTNTFGTGTTATLGQSDTLCFAMVGIRNAGINTADFNNSYGDENDADDGNGGDAAAIFTGYREINGATTAQTTTGSWTPDAGNTSVIAGIACYDATFTGGGGSSVVPLILQQSAANDDEFEQPLVANSR